MTIPQYFAQIDENNIVISVHVVTHLFMEQNPERYTGTWIETFTDLPNKTYAGIGYTYDPETQDFIAPYFPPVPTNETPNTQFNVCTCPDRVRNNTNKRTIKSTQQRFNTLRNYGTMRKGNKWLKKNQKQITYTRE